LEAYCVKCKTKREIKDPLAVFTKSGTPGTRGKCPVCDANMFLMGKTESHNGLTPPKPETKKKKRSGKLVIVESPAKARTVGRFLGKAYKVQASVGHVRDLLRSQLSVDVDNNFAPKYRVPNEKRPIVKELKVLSDEADEVYLATDPDREGEAIAWHLLESAEIDDKRAHRVVFHEITKPAIDEAFSHSRNINMDLVNAQQARRVLDRLVGYNLSPLLWRKVRGRLSAGRVQSVALRLIVEREREIDEFIPVEYWTIAAEFQPEGIDQTFIAKLVKINGSDPTLETESNVQPILSDMEQASYYISKIKRGQRKRNPFAPFITSTLQQEASRRLGFTARRTMALAQQLYEGIDTGDVGEIGLITYMRTDSTNVSPLAQKEARDFISKRYGNNFLPESPNIYKTQSRGAQEAHEAIRPTSVFRQPEALREFLSRDQYRLYQLIWKRFVASQMSSAIFDTLSVEILGKSSQHKYLLRASGSTLKFPGFLIVYEEIKDEEENSEEESAIIPEGISERQPLLLVRLLPEQHFTQPPPRYSEATLVKVLEEYGIGRPSTYAPILGTIQNRGYVIRDSKKLIPTETGFLVNDLLVENFPDVLNVDFTSHLEADLDRIAIGEIEWVDVVRNFYEPFSERVSLADKRIPELNMGPEPIGRDCPKCGHELVIRWGRYGKFISCGNFPECRHTEPWLEKIGVRCPLDGGELVERKTRKGRIFYGCFNYPECEFSSWKKPLPASCPTCSGLLVVADKRNAQCINCEERFPIDEVSIENAPESVI